MSVVLDRGAFMGCEEDGVPDGNFPLVASGLGMGAGSNHIVYKTVLDNYANLHFLNEDGSYNMKTVVLYVTEIFQNFGLRKSNEIQEISGIWIYPKEFFCPMDSGSKQINITDKTLCIHHFCGSWVPRESFIRKVKWRIKCFVCKVCGIKK